MAMKKHLSLLFAIIMAFSLVACADTSQDIPITGTQEAEFPTEPSSARDEPSIDVSYVPSPSERSMVSVDEQILLDQNNIIITLKSLIFDEWRSPELRILVENNSEKSIEIQTRDGAVNGIMVDAYLFANVEPGKKLNEGIILSSSDLEQAGIATIKDIEFTFFAYDLNLQDTVFSSEIIHITTTADVGFRQEYNDGGTLLYEDDGLKIVIQGKKYIDDYWGAAEIDVYIENLTASDIAIQLRNTSINGFMVDPVFTCAVLTGKRAYDSIWFSRDDFTTNDISSIEEMEFSLRIRDYSTWDLVKETGTLTVSFSD
jgi:hypothetical protein